MRTVIAFSLIGVYLFYLMLTIPCLGQAGRRWHGTAAEKPLYLTRALKPTGWRENNFLVLLQLAAGLAMIIGGARGFVFGVEALRRRSASPR